MDNLEELILACIAGERLAQNRLYTLFAPRLFMVCQRYSNSRAEAEDILQEGFIRIFNHLRQFSHKGSFEGWMRKIIVNCALQRYNNKKNQIQVITLDNEFPHSENDKATANLGEKELLKLIRQLPPVYKLVFNLYVFEGYKHREIAEILGISEGTSKSNLSDARTLLQKEIIKLNHIQEQKIRC